MKSSALVTEMEDRWLVDARHSAVTGLAASASVLQIELDSGLCIEAAGPWRATVGSPITGAELGIDHVGDQEGSRILSLVLFAAGSVRIVLATGVTVTVKADDATHVKATLPGTFTWEAHGRSVTHWFADAGNDD